MADNFLERQRDDYEKRKEKWIKKKKLISVSCKISKLSHEQND